MNLRSICVALGLAAMSVATVHADDSALAQRGKVAAYTCHGCHGIENYKNVYPTYSVPKLGGQHAKYIEDALKGYANGERAHSTMAAHAASISDEDRKAIAAYFQGPTPRASAAAKGTAPAAVTTCANCHGADGVSVSDQYPILAGQHRDYLEQALRDYKSGKRKNAIMAGFAAQIDEKDIPAIAEFFSKQDSPLCMTDKVRKIGKCR